MTDINQTPEEQQAEAERLERRQKLATRLKELEKLGRFSGNPGDRVAARMRGRRRLSAAKAEETR